MNRSQKQEFVDSLGERLSTAELLVFADFRGVTVAEISALRDQLRAAGISYQVVKNTLAKRAIAGTPLESLGDCFVGMTGVISAHEEGIAAAKLLREITKDFKKAEKFVVKGGYFDGLALDAKEIEKVADLPSREDMLAPLLATMQEGPRQVLGVIQGPARDILYVLKNYETKLEEEAAG